MGRNNADFQEGAKHIVVYRGLEDVIKPHHIDFSNLGVHWTTDLSTADEFAVPAWTKENPDLPKVSGAVVHGLVHPTHILDLNSDEAKGWGEWRMGEDHWEQEKTVKPGSPVKILKVERVDMDNTTDKITRRNLRGAPSEGTA